MTCALETDNLAVGYGDRVVVSGVTLRVEPGQLVAILGGNGSGKTTVLRAIYGRSTVFAGSIRIAGVQQIAVATHTLVARGVGIAPQGETVFPSLTVRENLLIGLHRSRAELNECVARLHDLFPEIGLLLMKTAGVLSGGERQLVGVCRALAGEPRLLLLDEPGAGFSPALATRFLGRLAAIARDRHVGVLMVEQHVAAALDFVDRVVVLRDGRQVFEGSATSLDSSAAITLLLGRSSVPLPP